MPAKSVLDCFRHGIAEELKPDQADPQRALTQTGRIRTRQVAEYLKTLGWQWQTILTSPLCRAQQTAEILLEVGLSEQIELFPDLAPTGSFQALVDWHEQHPDINSWVIVGHQPDLSRWIRSSMGDGSGGEILLKKAGVARLEFRQGRIREGEGILSGLLSPKLCGLRAEI